MADRRSFKIITQYIHPPIPSRHWDFCAHFDGEEEGPVGWGPTISDALDDLQMATDLTDRPEPERRERLDVLAAYYKTVTANG